MIPKHPVDVRLMLLFLTSCLAVFSPADSKGDDLTQEFLTKAPEAWSKNIRLITHGLEGTYSEDPESRVVLLDDCFLIESMILGGKVSERVVWGGNPFYDFWLTKIPADSPVWTVRELIIHDRNDSHSMKFKRISRDLQKNWRQFPYSVSGIWYSPFALSTHEVLNDPRFQVVSAERVQRENKPVLLISWRFSNDEADSEGPAFADSGSFVADPSRNWCLLEATATWSEDKFELNGHVVYDDFERVNSAWVPRSVKYIVRRDGMQELDKQAVYDWRELEDPDSIFLAHYGLPEPLKRKGSWPPWLTFLLAGVLLVVIVAALRKLQKN